MKVEVIVGNNLYSVAEAVVGSIEVSDSLELENFVVVPDRFSLLAEKLQFSQNNINSTFNIKIVGISKLATYFSPKLEVLSSDQSRIKIYRALKELGLDSFAPSFELSSQIFNIISQLKASQISPEEFSDSAKNKKLLDLSLVYKKYEEEKEFADSSDVLSNLLQNMDEEKISNCNFFFAGFDSLTAQGEKILEKLCLLGKRVVVGAIRPSNQKNYFIYDEDILNKINKIRRNHKIEVSQTFLKDEFNDEGGHILRNLFSGKENFLETDKVFLLQFEKPEKEAEEIAKTILFKIKQENKSFSDFNVLVGNLEEGNKIFREVFSSYNIPYFVDLGVKVETLPIYNFFKNLFEFIIGGDQISFVNLLTNCYLNVDANEISEFENYCLKFGFDQKSFEKFENINEIYNKIEKNKLKIEKNNKIINFSNIIKEIIVDFNLKEINSKLTEKFSKENLNNEKIYLQIFNKLDEVLENLTEEIEVDFEEFSTIFLSLFGEKEISSVPVSIDCVFLGGEKSFFERRDVLFVAGAKQGQIPKTVKDVGILCDQDISSSNLPITPTVRMINKRNKQKLLFDLSLAKEIFVSFSENELGEKEEKSSLFYELGKIFSRDSLQIKITSNFYERYGRERLLKFSLQNNLDYEKFVLSLLKEQKISKAQAEQLIVPNKEKREQTSKNLFKKLSPTEIENFFKCPFKHFFFYGLGIKENQTNNFDGRDFGNYFHMVAKQFVERNLKKIQTITKEEIDREFEQIVSNVLKSERFSLLKTNKENDHLFALLKKEAKTMVNKIVYEQQNSNFLVRYVEKPFNYNLGELSLSGVVDRVDVSGEYFRVVDYKSGEISRSLKKVYHGVELQLFIYLIAIEAMFGLVPAGGFYFPISEDYSAKDVKKFCLDGFVLDLQNIISDLDRRFGRSLESDIVALKLKKESSPNNLVLSTKKNVFSKEGFESVLLYVKKLIERAKEEILSGKFPASPIGDSFETSPCRGCPLFCVCSFKDSESQEIRTFGKELSEQDFKRIVGDE